MKDELAKAVQNKSPLKMTGVKSKRSYFDKIKTGIEVTRNTALEVLEENGVAFEYIKYEQTDECSLVDVATILSSKKDIKTRFHFIYILTVEERPMVPTLLK